MSSNNGFSISAILNRFLISEYTGWCVTFQPILMFLWNHVWFFWKDSISSITLGLFCFFNLSVTLYRFEPVPMLNFSWESVCRILILDIGRQHVNACMSQWSVILPLASVTQLRLFIIPNELMEPFMNVVKGSLAGLSYWVLNEICPIDPRARTESFILSGTQWFVILISNTDWSEKYRRLNLCAVALRCDVK
jgi:hypothetical protein